MRPEMVLVYALLTFFVGFIILLILALCATASRTDDILDKIEKESHEPD